jgi:prephenate dehydrogenase
VAEQGTGNTPAVYAEIQDAFDGANRVAEAAARLADADSEEFAELYREAGTDREGGSTIETETDR